MTVSVSVSVFRLPAMGAFTLKNDNDTERQAKDKPTVVKQQ